MDSSDTQRYLDLICSNRLNILKKLLVSNFSSDHATLLKIYHALIKSKLDCGSSTLSLAEWNILQSLNTIHYLTIRLAIGAFLNFLISSILCETNDQLLKLYRNLNVLKAYIYIKSNSSNPFSHSSKHFRLLKL